MNYTADTERARPYIESLRRWMQKHGIVISICNPYTNYEEKTRNLFHPKATHEEILSMCLPYFSRCEGCELGPFLHPLIQTGEYEWLHLCTKIAIAKGIVSKMQFKELKND